ncbi:MAG: hypothetical protein Q7K16_01185 [Candidatus Azambacteria bacterium]|nr:hypothetical protein [Candidatus Azambacteria bacterium]
MSGIRALELCLECSNAIETITLDSILTPGKCCRQEVKCVRLSRHWPACRAGEDVFSEKPVCDKLVVGSPTKAFPPFRIVALPCA